MLSMDLRHALRQQAMKNLQAKKFVSVLLKLPDDNAVYYHKFISVFFETGINF